MVSGNPTKWIKAWIDSIPDSKLEGGIRDRGKIYHDRDLRLDCQETLRGEVAEYNLQVQVNKQCRHTSVKNIAPDTVAYCFAPVDEPWSADKIREELKKTVTGWGIDKVDRKQ